jgi:hypothetical protein
MTVSLLLRHIHATATKTTLHYGPFKLRVTESQFKASITLYRILMTPEGNSKADMAIHALFKTLLCTTSPNNRAINYPTDQVLFLWTYLSYRTYRIPSHVQALLAAAKYCFRCISLQIAKLQVTADALGPLLEDIASTSSIQDVELKSSDVSQNGKDTSFEDSEGAPQEIAPDNIDVRAYTKWLLEKASTGTHGDQGMPALKYNRNAVFTLMFFPDIDSSAPLHDDADDEVSIMESGNIYEYVG